MVWMSHIILWFRPRQYSVCWLLISLKKPKSKRRRTLETQLITLWGQERTNCGWAIQLDGKNILVTKFLDKFWWYSGVVWFSFLNRRRRSLPSPIMNVRCQSRSSIQANIQVLDGTSSRYSYGSPVTKICGEEWVRLNETKFNRVGWI